MTEFLLVLNSGSSSVKFSAFKADDLDLLIHGQVEGLGTAPRLVISHDFGERLEEQVQTGSVRFDHAAALDWIAEYLQRRLHGHQLVAAGHRVVHGGMKYAAPIRVDRSVIDELEQLIPLAPLHQPHHLAAIRAVFRQSPDLPQVASFDTAFHRTQPEVAQWFGLPRYYTDLGVRRYGFHGLSYEYVASLLATLDPKAALGRTIVAHLGNGASLCALRAGNSIATTMSFTPADGLIMGTRGGAIDPGVLLYLMTSQGMDSAALEKLIYYESGLLGVSGFSSDMRTLLASNDPQAHAAINLFIYRLGRELGSLVAALGGLDALVFTGGIGEHAPLLRERVCRDAAWTGLRLDHAANEQGLQRLSEQNSPVAVWVIATNEELMIAKHTRQVLGLKEPEK